MDLGICADLPTTITRRIVIVRGISVGFALSSTISTLDAEGVSLPMIFAYSDTLHPTSYATPNLSHVRSLFPLLLVPERPSLRDRWFLIWHDHLQPAALLGQLEAVHLLSIEPVSRVVAMEKGVLRRWCLIASYALADEAFLWPSKAGVRVRSLCRRMKWCCITVKPRHCEPGVRPF